jgi:hypothetical protein
LKKYWPKKTLQFSLSCLSYKVTLRMSNLKEGWIDQRWTPSTWWSNWYEQGNECHEKNLFVECVASMHKVHFHNGHIPKKSGLGWGCILGMAPLIGFTHHKG